MELNRHRKTGKKVERWVFYVQNGINDLKFGQNMIESMKHHIRISKLGVISPPKPQLAYFLVEHPCDFRARPLHCETYWHTQTQFYRHIFYDICWIPNNRPYQPKPPIGTMSTFDLNRSTVKPLKSHRRWQKLESYENLTLAPRGQKLSGQQVDHPFKNGREFVVSRVKTHYNLKKPFSEWEGTPRFM